MSEAEVVLCGVAAWLSIGLAAALAFKSVQLRRFPEASSYRHVMIGYFVSSMLLGPITWVFAVYRHARGES